MIYFLVPTVIFFPPWQLNTSEDVSIFHISYSSELLCMYEVCSYFLTCFLLLLLSHFFLGAFGVRFENQTLHSSFPQEENHRINCVLAVSASHWWISCCNPNNSKLSHRFKPWSPAMLWLTGASLSFVFFFFCRKWMESFLDWAPALRQWKRGIYNSGVGFRSVQQEHSSHKNNSDSSGVNADL